MAKKGESKIMTRLNAPRTVSIHRKEKPFIIKPRCGPHPKVGSVALGVVIRDLLSLAYTAAEMKKIVKKDGVKVDGKTCKDPKRAIGFMDVISIAAIDKYYRMVYNQKGQLHPKKIERKRAVFKLSKVRNKRRVKGGKMQLSLHDGKNIRVEKKIRVGDVLQLELPTLRIIEVLYLKNGCIAYITGGKHAGQSGTVTGMTPGTARRTAMTTIKTKEREIKTQTSYVFVLGDEKPIIDIAE